MDWLLNPYGIGYTAWVFFIVGSIAAVAVGIAAGLAALWRNREKKDGIKR